MFNTIASGVDGSPSARNALTVAAGLARTLGSKLIIFYVQEITISRGGFLTEDPTATRAELHRTAEQLRSEGIDATVRYARALTRDTPRTILELAERADADVLVIGDRGHRPLENLVGGSVAARLLRFAPYPVLLVPYESPDGTSTTDFEPAGAKRHG